MKLFVREPGSDHMAELWSSREAFASSSVAYAEVRAAVGAAERARRITVRHHAIAVAELDDVWPIVSAVEARDPVAFVAGALAARHGLRALDAVHLASALAIDDDVVFVSWDSDLRRAAGAEGLALSPA